MVDGMTANRDDGSSAAGPVAPTVTMPRELLLRMLPEGAQQAAAGVPDDQMAGYLAGYLAGQASEVARRLDGYDEALSALQSHIDDLAAGVGTAATARGGGGGVGGPAVPKRGHVGPVVIDDGLPVVPGPGEHDPRQGAPDAGPVTLAEAEEHTPETEPAPEGEAGTVLDQAAPRIAEATLRRVEQSFRAAQRGAPPPEVVARVTDIVSSKIAEWKAAGWTEPPTNWATELRERLTAENLL